MKPEVVKFMIEAADMDRAVSFYRDTLGFEEKSVSPYWSELSFGDAVIGIHGGGSGEPKKTGLSVQYADVASVFALAVENGASSIQSPEQRDSEPIILSAIRDPEGNEIMLTQFVG